MLEKAERFECHKLLHTVRIADVYSAWKYDERIGIYGGNNDGILFS